MLGSGPVTEVGFYHLQATPLERALPRLLEKALERGMRALVVAGSRERAAQLDELLWSYDAASFLPHGSAGMDPRRQPVWLAEDDANLNHAGLLVLLDGQTSERLASFERAIDLFDGHDRDAIAAARERWQACKQAGHHLSYWQQTRQGGWEKKAEA